MLDGERAPGKALKRAGVLPWIIALTALALALRLYRLAGPVVLRWDEGWSLAHASLPWGALWQVATAEWHPPAYIALLKLWLAAGRGAWSMRMLSVLLSVLAVPLAYGAGQAWSGKRRTGILMAGFVAVWPLLVYYGQVARPYALAALAVLAAAWFMLRSDDGPTWRDGPGLVLSSALALFTFYNSAFALAALWLYAAALRPRRTPRLLVLGFAALALYLPWIVAALGTIESRAGGTEAGLGPTVGMLAQARLALLEGLPFTYGTTPWAAAVLAAVLVAGLVAGRLSGSEAKRLLLPLFGLGLGVAGAAYSAGVYWFAVRHLVPAAPFLGLALAWALDRLWGLWRPLLAVALVALAVAYWPTCSRFVYEKSLEVTDPFDPSEDYRYLAGRAGPGDLVYFNVLARAGWYESLRRPHDAAWSYAMRWDPIVEPLERIAARIAGDSQTHRRLWFVLYKGSYGPNGDLVAWLNDNLYPAGGEWQGDMLYLACVAPGGDWASAPRDDGFEGGIRLVGARWTPAVRAGDAAALELTWSAGQQVAKSYKVFVHVTDGAGRVVAQHDGVPGAGNRPTDSWEPGAMVADRHGLLLPAACPAELHICVGLYDPDTGERLRLAGGSDAVELCTLGVSP